MQRSQHLRRDLSSWQRAGLALGVALIGSASAAAGQRDDLVDVPRLMYWSQLSRWTPEGSDSGIALIADSAMAVRWLSAIERQPDTLWVTHAEFGREWAVALDRGPNGQLRDFRFPEDSMFDFEPDFGLLLVEALATASPRPFDRGAWNDTSTIRHGTRARTSEFMGDTIGGDTLEWHRVRPGRVLGRVDRSGHTWLLVRGEGRDSLTVRRSVDIHLGRIPEVKVAVGTVTESYLLDPMTGEIDSLRQEVRWHVVSRFLEITGKPTTVEGDWYAIRQASRGESIAKAAAAAQEFRWVHGRDEEPGASAFPNGIQALVDASLRGDSLALVRLFELRASSSTLEDRWLAERAIGAAGMSWQHRLQALHTAQAFFQPGDVFLARDIAWKTRDAVPLDTLDVRILAQIFGTYRAQRTTLVDRDEYFPQLLDAVAESDSITEAAADRFAVAADTTDDPQARDLFYLGAYRGNPGRYLDTIRVRTDSLRGFGPIVRRFAEGDYGAVGWSWGIRDYNLDEHAVTPIPSLQAGWEAHAETAASIREGESARRFREWGRGHEPSADSLLRVRFATEPAMAGKLVWARYLLALGDTLPAPWIRALSENTTQDAYARAHSVMQAFPIFTDTITSGPALDDLQGILLGYAAGIRILVDTAGQRVPPFSAHDERPDLRLLSTHGLTAAILADPSWHRYFDVLTPDSLQARGEREGIVMAFSVSPVTRVGKEYSAGVALHPYMKPGGMCLCGGGTFFSLRYRDGRWLITSASRWIS